MEFRRVLFRSGHAFEDRVDSGLCRTFAVSVLDAQQELATVTLGVQIREQRSARAPDVEKTGRARREAGDDTHEDKSQWTAKSEEHTSELQSLMRISYAVFCLNKKNNTRYSKLTT